MSMSERVVEIVTFLIRELVQRSNTVGDESRLVKLLLENGYAAHEIDAAFQVIFSHETESNQADAPLPHGGIRVFSQPERQKLTMAAQSHLMRLLSAELITRDELEELLVEAMGLDVTDVGLSEVIWLLGQVIEDQDRARLLTAQVTNYPVADAKASGYWN